MKDNLNNQNQLVEEQKVIDELKPILGEDYYREELERILNSISDESKKLKELIDKIMKIIKEGNKKEE